MRDLRGEGPSSSSLGGDVASPQPSVSFGLGGSVRLGGGQELTPPRDVLPARAAFALLPKSSEVFQREVESLSTGTWGSTREGAWPPAGNSGSRVLPGLLA